MPSPRAKPSAIQRLANTYSLRPFVIFCACLGFIWAVVMGVQNLQNRAQPNASSKQNLIDLIQAIMYFIIALVEGVIFIIAIMQNVVFGRVIMVLAPLGVVVTIAAQVVGLIRHFALKDDLIKQCTTNTSGVGYTASNGTASTVTNEQAGRICSAAWERETWTVIAWLICAIILAGIFAYVALGYYRQLQDPSSIRQRLNRNQQVEQYALQPNQQYNHNAYANNPPPPSNNNGEQSWMVPPYPGPPVNMPPKGYEKSDYQPEAEWANYEPPSGPPPPNRGGFGGGNGDSVEDRERAQEEAWIRAENTGPTAHITSPNRSMAQPDTERGYVGRNEEEDDAWERAKREGVTAHLTGPAPGGSK